MRGATQIGDAALAEIKISIHAPHAGRDDGETEFKRSLSISIHAPHAGRDPSAACVSSCKEGFQSTRPMRGATRGRTVSLMANRNFNPRAPCGARRYAIGNPRFRIAISIHAPHAGRDPWLTYELITGSWISIHAPHAGRDAIAANINLFENKFQSTRPMRGATVCIISRIAVRKNFNPRAPCGARRSVL